MEKNILHRIERHPPEKKKKYIYIYIYLFTFFSHYVVGI